MGWKFNPFTGTLDQTGSGGGGSSVIEGEVDTYNDLPLDGTAPVNSSWLVRTASGSWFTGGSKPAGIYVRVNTVGSSRDNDYVYAGLLPSAFSDSDFKLYDNGDSTKTAQFQLSGITAGQNRAITVPDKNITLDDSGDARTPASHTHGNLTNAGAIGSTSGLPVVTTTSGAITTLALGSAGQVLKVNSGGTAVEFGAASGGISAVGASVSDILSVSGSDLVADDPNADRLVFWDDSAGALKYLTAGSGLTITGDTITASGGVGGNSGATDNSVLRADGAGGATLQNSDLIIDDYTASTQGNITLSSRLVSFSCTATASDDFVTATGHTFSNGDQVVFTSITGGGGLAVNTRYFVVSSETNKFKCSTTSGGSAINITTDATAGTVQRIAAFCINPQNIGAFILGPKPDGTTVGGNSRGLYAVDLQLVRTAATQVPSGPHSFSAGRRNTVSGWDSAAFGNANTVTFDAAFAAGETCTASANFSISMGRSCTTSGGNAVVAIGNTGTASATSALFIGGQNSTASAEGASCVGARAALANRYYMQAHAAGDFSGTSGSGEAQRARFVLRCKTTTNAAVEMALDGGTTYLTIPSGKVIFCNIKVVGVRSTGAEVATYERQYAAKNVGGVSSEVYAPVTIGTDNAAGTSLEVATVDAGDYIRIRPTGVLDQVWRWVCSVDAVECSYGT